MTEAEFDVHADTYRRQHADSVRLAGEDLDYFAAYKIEHVASVLARAGQSPRTILDFGAGIGNSYTPLRQTFPDNRIVSLDVSEGSLSVCRKLHPDAETCLYDGRKLPFDDGTFDLAFTACVFHHIDASEHIGLLGEIRRVLRTGGRFFLFEHNPLNPLTRHAVRTCPFDEHAVLIAGREMMRRTSAAGFSTSRLQYQLFFPGPLAALRPLENALRWLPLGAQYSLECCR
ncbi:class I SAM-dependent methyltransferase [Sphingosinicella xenopeptidilytica]|uniref:Class I SAM-dependent methyltransferase n=1 Tax=Sphingosinicella xenopeptidilytica TaxID=364098 RepID=A0ABW3CA08_SPHXN